MALHITLHTTHHWLLGLHRSLVCVSLLLLAVAKLLGAEWKALSTADKQPYVDKHERLLDEYKEQLADFNRKYPHYEAHTKAAKPKAKPKACKVAKKPTDAEE
jgi:ABC-type transporter MlaC component